MNRSIVKSLVASLILALALAGCSSQKASILGAADKAKTETVKIGVLGAMSGDAGTYGIEMQRVLEYQLPKVNAVLSRQGKRMELVYEDGKCSGSEAVSAFQKLADIDGIRLIIGGFCSSETLAVAPLAQAKKVVLLSPASSNPAIGKEGDFVFTLSYSDDLVGKGIAGELRKFNKVALITEQNDYNIGIQKMVLESLKSESGVQVVANEVFPKGGSDFRNSLEKIAQAEPEALLLNPNGGVTAENLLRQVAEIPQLKSIRLIGQFSYLADDIRKSADDAVSEGMVIIDAPKLTNPELLKAKEEIEKGYGSVETLGLYFTASAMDDLNLLATLVGRFGNDPAKIKKALRSETFQGYLGTIRFGDQNFVQNIPVGRYVVQNGKAVYRGQ